MKPIEAPKPPRKACMFKPVSWALVLQVSSRYARSGLSQESAQKSKSVTPIATKDIAIIGDFSNEIYALIFQAYQ